MNTCPNSYSGDLNRFSNLFSKIPRYFFKYNTEGTGFFYNSCIFENFVCFLFVFSSFSITSELIYALRGQADMSHDRDSGLGYLPDCICNSFSPFKFYTTSRSFFHYSTSISETLINPQLI